MVSVNIRISLLFVSASVLVCMLVLLFTQTQQSSLQLDQLLPTLANAFRRFQDGNSAKVKYKKGRGDESRELFLLSSCSGRGGEWTWSSSPGVGARLSSWVGSMVTVSTPTEARSWWFETESGEFSQHSTQADKIIFLESSTELYDDQYLMTVGSSANLSRPVGFAWQRLSNHPLDGWLYGEVDREGRFTGEEVTYIYPDMETGLKGRFHHGRVVEARAVKVVGERCGASEIKELQFENIGPEGVVWSIPKGKDISSNPYLLDPFEEKSVTGQKSKTAVSTSKNDGVFAARDFIAGELVSYFNGKKTYDKDMFNDDMTDEEYENAAAYYYGLGNDAPYSWGYDAELELDIPQEFRKLSDYTTTLGHKVNHRFTNTNVFFSLAKHPLYGGIVILVAEKAIKEGEELYVNYGYTNGITYREFKKSMKDYSKWFIEEFQKLPANIRKSIFDGR